MGDKVNFCVPTGNFGNILAAYYAKRMGLPVGKLICASNCNNVLTDFLRTGVYDRNRPFHNTMSPSMDILISSNLERLLFDLSGGNDAEVRGYMEALAKDRTLRGLAAPSRRMLQELFWGGFCDEAGHRRRHRARYYRDHGYLIDTHTAVAASVMEQYRRGHRRRDGDRVRLHRLAPISSATACCTAIGEDARAGDGVELIDQLQTVTGVPAPRRLAALKGKARRFDLPARRPAWTAWCWTFCTEKAGPTAPWADWCHPKSRKGGASMALYAIGDLHLSLAADKSMEVFGGGLGELHGAAAGRSLSAAGAGGYASFWLGDTSWGMTLEEAEADFRFHGQLPGRKLLVKGNHDYWWTTAVQDEDFFCQEKGITNLDFLHNNCYLLRGLRPCAAPGAGFWEEEQKRPGRQGSQPGGGAAGDLAEGGRGPGEAVLSPLSAPVPGLPVPGDPADCWRSIGVERCCYGHLHGAS